MSHLLLKKIFFTTCLACFFLSSMKILNQSLNYFGCPHNTFITNKECATRVSVPPNLKSNFHDGLNNSHLQVSFLNAGFKCGVDGIVTVKSGGRLGNLMGEYATLWAIALRDGVFPILQQRTHVTLTKYFSNISIPNVKYLRCTLKWVHMNLHVYNKLDKKERARLAREGIYIDGYPTSVSMFHRYRPDILKQFIFKKYLTDQARTKLSKMQKNRQPVTYIGVHVRREDYADFLLRRYKGQLVGEAYFKRAMDYFRHRYPQRLFVVASDDMDWCSQYIKPVEDDVVFAGNRDAADPAEDMALLASCNHSIITYGNFGFWSAYMAAGETILTGNVSEVPLELQRSIMLANIEGWRFFPGF